jgi:hypothetical protein
MRCMLLIYTNEAAQWRLGELGVNAYEVERPRREPHDNAVGRSTARFSRTTMTGSSVIGAAQSARVVVSRGYSNGW